MAEEALYRCPLCCNEEFSSLEGLSAHLLDISENLACPKCYDHFQSIRTLAEHLGVCSTYEAFEENTETITPEALPAEGIFYQVPIIDTNEENDESSLQQMQVSIVSGNGVEEVFLLPHGRKSDFINSSLSAHEFNSAAHENNLAYKAEEAEEVEMYSCNSCGMSFQSVLEHIENFHVDQDVVVQVNGQEEEIRGEKRVTNEISSEEAEVPTTDETPGDIVEEQILDKEGRVYLRRFVQVDVDSLNIKSEAKPAEKVKEESSEILEKHICRICNIPLQSAKALNGHMRIHKAEGKKKAKAAAAVTEDDTDEVYHCQECSTTFATNKSLMLHRRMHLPVKPRALDAPIEGIDNLPNASIVYTCPICDKRIHYAYKAAHEKHHLNDNKDVEMSPVCNICNREFATMQAFEMHSKIHINNSIRQTSGDVKKLPYACAYCNRTFARPHEKVKHERVHTGEKPHACEICGKTFRVAYCLTLHLRTHNGARPHACHFCPKRFKSQSVFSHHLLTHSDARAYKCPFCPKAFKTSVQLSGHKNSHTKPFQCTECNRPFSSLYAVRTHMATHQRSNSLRFSCVICGASYGRTFALKDHIKAAHPESGLADNIATPTGNDKTQLIFEEDIQNDIELVLQEID